MLPGLDTPGYLGLISGAMFSGKTSKLIELYKQYTLCEVDVCVINYSGDKRYSDTQLSTHDGVTIPCTWAECLEGLQHVSPVATARVILINEGQFFPDIVPWVTEQVEGYEKIIFICGLDGDFMRKGFGSWLDLIPLCDEVTKLTALCSLCKRQAGLFSKRLTEDKQQVLIGSAQYIPVCRRCYHSKTLPPDIKLAQMREQILQKRHCLALHQQACMEIPRSQRMQGRDACNLEDVDLQIRIKEYKELLEKQFKLV